MIKKFLLGLAFGLGFSIAALSVYTVWIVAALPAMVEGQFQSELAVIDANKEAERYPHTNNFHDLPLDQQIKLATVIIRTELTAGEDGEPVTKVAEILKQEQGVEFYYSIGDVYDYHRSYSGSSTYQPKGYIVFMQGNPARMTYSVSYNDDRIGGLGDIPLVLLRKKCKQ